MTTVRVLKDEFHRLFPNFNMPGTHSYEIQNELTKIFTRMNRLGDVALSRWKEGDIDSFVEVPHEVCEELRATMQVLKKTLR